MTVVTILPHHEICPEGATIEVAEGENLCQAMLERGIKLNTPAICPRHAQLAMLLYDKAFDSLEEMDDIEGDLL